ncbi:MAG: chaperone modulator CbpM [Ketobacteraceae bacterium]|nr:chaperone modulator CbpM [Ketobacteraceae bacterium]
MDKLTIEVLGNTTVYSLREVCERCGMHAEQVIEFVDFGIAEPEGNSARDWHFTAAQLFRLNRALRLQRDLDINLPGLALALDLLEEIDALRSEVQSLRSLR